MPDDVANTAPIGLAYDEAQKVQPLRPDGLPRDFRVTDAGIEFQIEDNDGNAEWRWLCSPIRVLALSRGADGKGWGRLVEIRDPDRRWHRWAMPAEMFAGDGIDLRRECFRLGLLLSNANGAKQKLSTLLQNWKPIARVVACERLGWTDETCTAFMLGNGEVIGRDDVVFQSENLPGMAAEMHPKGKLTDWQNSVSACCAGNPLLVMSVSLALSGPLLEMLKQDGGGIHLRGESSRGKSTILKAAASVWGSPEFVQSWRATSNGLEGVAVVSNSSLIALDEMSEVDAREAGRVVYMLSNGTGKARANRAGAARPVAHWKVPILSSGELSLADKMAEAGQRKRAGQDVRLIDIPADNRAHGAFDSLHGMADGAAFAEHLNMAAAKNYGTAGPEFVARILEDLEAATKNAQRLIEEFVQIAMAELAPGPDGQVRRVLARIGLIVAAGEMATALGITGWESGEVTAAGMKLVRLWLACRGGTGAQEAKDAIDRTRAFIVKHGDSRFENLDKETPDQRRINDRAGWKTGGNYYFAKDAWDELHKGFNPTNAARAVRDAGFLITEKDRLQTKLPSKIDGRPRCYCVSSNILGDDDDD